MKLAHSVRYAAPRADVHALLTYPASCEMATSSLAGER
jgi:hypothetical protein